MDAVSPRASGAPERLPRVARRPVSAGAAARWAHAVGRDDVVLSSFVAGGLLAGLVRSHHSHDPLARAESRQTTFGGERAVNGRIVIAGGNGFLGQVLGEKFSERDCE